MRVCVVTTSYPRTPDDVAGSFVRDSVYKLLGRPTTDRPWVMMPLTSAPPTPWNTGALVSCTDTFDVLLPLQPVAVVTASDTTMVLPHAEPAWTVIEGPSAAPTMAPPVTDHW